MVSITVEYFFLLWVYTETDCGLLQQLANRSYLKSQKLKETAADRQRISLLEKESMSLSPDYSIGRAFDFELTKKVVSDLGQQDCSWA